MQNSDNLYSFIVKNGEPGFWARNTRDNDFAYILGMAKIKGPPPYYGSPPIIADVYCRMGTLCEELVHLERAGVFGEWKYRQRPNPDDVTFMRTLDAPEIFGKIYDLGYQPHDFTKMAAKKLLAEAPKLFRRLSLNVPFDRKEEAKVFGAQWAPDNKKWWIKSTNKEGIQEALNLGFLETTALNKPGKR